MKTNSPTNCPHCKCRNTVEKFNRRCTNCGMNLFFDGDTPSAVFEQWYMFCERGKFGRGWYQKALLTEAEFITSQPSYGQA